MTDITEWREKLLDYFADGAPSYRHANEAVKATARSKADDIMSLTKPLLQQVDRESRLDEMQRANNHRRNLQMSVPALPNPPKSMKQYILDRIKALIQKGKS